MEQKTFDDFCDGKKVSKNFREAFYHFLMARYGGIIPNDADLEKDWKDFLAHTTKFFLSGG